jgi:hypothetical protein
MHVFLFSCQQQQAAAEARLLYESQAKKINDISCSKQTGTRRCCGTNKSVLVFFLACKILKSSVL